MSKTRTISVQAPIQRLETRVLKDSVNVEKRTVKMVFASEKPVRTYRWRGWDVEEFNEILSMDAKHMRRSRLDKGAVPLLDSHSRWNLRSTLGTVLDAEFVNKQLEGTTKFSKRKDVQEIFEDVIDGVIANGSVGYRVHEYKDETKEGDKIKTLRAIDWELIEMSLVPIGADENAGSMNGKRSDGQEDELHECRIHLREEAENVNETRCEGDLRADLNPQEDNMNPKENKSAGETTNPAPATVNEQEVRAAALAEERKRTSEIYQAVNAAKLGEDVAKRFIEGGTAIDQVRKEIIDLMAKRDEERGEIQTTAEVTQDASDKFRDGASQMLILRAGAGVAAMMEKHSGKKLDAGEFRGMSLIDLARESLERQGIKTRGMDKMTLVGKAFTHRSGMNTTSDFPLILENTLHKILLGAYAVTPDTWSRFCKRGSVSDFRPHPRYRLGSFGALDSKNEHGEFKNKSIPDAEKASITAGTKGNIIGLSRESIINDDMGAFNDLATRFGRAAKLSVETDVYTLLALNGGLGPSQSDSQPLFHSNRANVNGTGSALSAAGLDADRVVMGAQKDPSGNEILDLRPAILLVPLGLGGQARVINGSQYDPDTVANKAQMKPNVVFGLFRDVVDTARLTGTRRYLFADPDIAPVIEVAFLDGQENPFMETKDGWRMDGVEWKVRLDYGVGAVDSRGAVTNAGQ